MVPSQSLGQVSAWSPRVQRSASDCRTPRALRRQADRAQDQTRRGRHLPLRPQVGRSKGDMGDEQTDAQAASPAASRARRSRAAAFGALGRSARWPRPRLRLFWWGNPERNKRTYARSSTSTSRSIPDVAIDAETIGWDDYWPKMATQASGRNMADVVQMDYRYLYEYARRQQLEPLDDYIGEGARPQPVRPEASSTAAASRASSTPCRGPATRSPATMTRTSSPSSASTMPDSHLDLGRPQADRRRDQEAGAGRLLRPWRTRATGSRCSSSSCASAARRSTTRRASSRYDEEDVADYFGLWDGLRQEGLRADGRRSPPTTSACSNDAAHDRQGRHRLRALQPDRRRCRRSTRTSSAMNMLPEPRRAASRGSTSSPRC